MHQSLSTKLQKSQIVYPEDLSLFTDMRKAVLQYLKDCEDKQDEIDSFSCTFRLLHKCSFTPHPLPQMIYHRMNPIWIDGELRYWICSIKSSTVKKEGNLRLHNMNQIYKKYNFVTKRWELIIPRVFTEREKTILMLAGQGKSSGEIARDLCKGQNTIQNQISALFAKLGVHSMQEAIEVADHYCISHLNQDIQDLKQSDIEVSDKKKRVSITKDKLQHIQQCLDRGKSVRLIAKWENIAESTIRYWIGKGTLKKR